MNLNFNQLINEIRKLNPGVDIRIGDPMYDSSFDSRIFCSVPIEQLKLPEGYYSNEKNGITNKHNSESGSYMSLNIEPLSNMVVEHTYPSVDVSKPLETTDVREIAIALQRLNPGVDIKLSNPNYSSSALSTIYCNVPMTELALPQPFYANEKNGITNKHNSESGMYTTISIEDINKVNRGILISTGYNLYEERRKQIANEFYQSNEYYQGLNAIGDSIKYTIKVREKDINSEKREKHNAAIMAGLSILGASVSVLFSGVDLHSAIQNELNAIYSWDALVQYVKDLGPLTTFLAASTAAFVMNYFRHTDKIHKFQKEFEDLNRELSNVQKLGGNEDARTR